MGQKPSKQPQVDPRYLAPQKLHCFNEVDLRKLRRLIKDRKLAPCCPGVDSESREVILGCTSFTGCRARTQHLCGIYTFFPAAGGVSHLLSQVPKPQPSSMLP